MQSRVSYTMETIEKNIPEGSFSLSAKNHPKFEGYFGQLPTEAVQLKLIFKKISQWPCSFLKFQRKFVISCKFHNAAMIPYILKVSGNEAARTNRDDISTKILNISLLRSKRWEMRKYLRWGSHILMIIMSLVIEN